MIEDGADGSRVQLGFRGAACAGVDQLTVCLSFIT
ncbi:MAG: hypothetical protein ACI9UA_005874, partial [Pseudoalteromonas tetraodonis]